MEVGLRRVGRSLRTCLAVKKKMVTRLKNVERKRPQAKKTAKQLKKLRKNEASESCKGGSKEDEESESDDR